MTGDKLPGFELKLKKNYHGDGRLYEILLYSEPNAGHGWMPIARFYPGFTDVEANAERIVQLWNDDLKSASIKDKEIADFIRDYHCPECDTPGFIHLIIPVKVANKFGEKE